MCRLRSGLGGRGTGMGREGGWVRHGVDSGLRIRRGRVRQVDPESVMSCAGVGPRLLRGSGKVRRRRTVRGLGTGENGALCCGPGVALIRLSVPGEGTLRIGDGRGLRGRH